MRVQEVRGTCDKDQVPLPLLRGSLFTLRNVHETLVTAPKKLPRVALKVVTKEWTQTSMTADTTCGDLKVKPHGNDVTARGTRSSQHATGHAR